jgi:type I restriction enzyme R subunit
VLRIAPFNAMGSVVQLIKVFGDRKGFEQAVHELQSALYQELA